MTKSAATKSNCEWARSQLAGSHQAPWMIRFDCCAHAGSDEAGALGDVLDRGGELLRDGRGADAVFEDQRKADDPGKELAHRGVRVGVGAARDRHHRAELRVAEGGEERRQAGQQVRDDHGRPGALDARADRREDSAADHRAQADGDEVFCRQRAAQNFARAKFAQLLNVGRRKERREERHYRPASERKCWFPAEPTTAAGSTDPTDARERRARR